MIDWLDNLFRVIDVFLLKLFFKMEDLIVEIFDCLNIFLFYLYDDFFLNDLFNDFNWLLNNYLDRLLNDNLFDDLYHFFYLLDNYDFNRLLHDDLFNHLNNSLTTIILLIKRYLNLTTYLFLFRWPNSLSLSTFLSQIYISVFVLLELNKLIELIRLVFKFLNFDLILQVNHGLFRSELVPRRRSYFRFLLLELVSQS